MKPRGKTAGTAVERKVLKLLREQGWWCVHASNSLGECDVVALKAAHRPRMIEVKSTVRGPFAGFPPSDRRDLHDAAVAAGADAYLAYWPPRKALALIPSYDWPVAA